MEKGGCRGGIFSVGPALSRTGVMLGYCAVAVGKNKVPKEDLVLCKPSPMIDEFHNCRFIIILIRNIILGKSGRGYQNQ